MVSEGCCGIVKRIPATYGVGESPAGLDTVNGRRIMVRGLCWIRRLRGGPTAEGSISL